MTVCPPKLISNLESFRVSVLGRLLFTLYTPPLSSMIREHAIAHHLYADGSQLYVSFASLHSAAALSGVQSGLASVRSWTLTENIETEPR